MIELRALLGEDFERFCILRMGSVADFSLLSRSYSIQSILNRAELYRLANNARGRLWTFEEGSSLSSLPSSSFTDNLSLRLLDYDDLDTSFFCTL